MKKKQPKPAHVRAKEAAEMEAEKLRTCIDGLRKVGKASAFHFVRLIKRAIECDIKTAKRHFEAAVRDGKIRRAGTNGAKDVEFYECQNLNENAGK